MRNIIHQKIVLKLGVALFEDKVNNVIELGEMMLKTEADNIANAGFWIWDYVTNEVYYSPKFCNSLGYEYQELGNDFKGFNLSNKEHLDTCIEKINQLLKDKSHSVFINEIDYITKNGNVINITCSGTIFYKNGNPKYILGTHKIN